MNRDIIYTISAYIYRPIIARLIALYADEYIYSPRLYRLFGVYMVNNRRILYIDNRGYYVRNIIDNIYTLYKYNIKIGIYKKANNNVNKYSIVPNIDKYETYGYTNLYIYEIGIKRYIYKLILSNKLYNMHIIDDKVIYVYQTMIYIHINLSERIINIYNVETDKWYNNIRGFNYMDVIVFKIRDNRIYILPEIYNNGAYIQFII